MSRKLTLPVHDFLQAGMRLRMLTSEKPEPGMPAPPFNAVLKAGQALRALMPILTAFVTQEAALRAEYTRRDETGQAVPVKDPNGNILDGQVYQSDPTRLNERLNALRRGEATVEVGPLSLDDVVDLSRGRLDVDALNDLLPLLDTQTLSDDGQARLAAYQAALVPKPPE